MKVKDSVVLITGANRGIGKGFAEEFLKAGAKKIYLGVRRPEKITNFIARDPVKLVPLYLDVTDLDHIHAAVQKAGDITILINNAGVLFGGSLADEKRLEDARHEMEVNYFGPLSMIHAFSPLLKANGGGIIINVSSIAGLVAMPGSPTYSTSKAAVHFLTLEARMELKAHGTRVMGIYPGPVDTDMARSFDVPKVSPHHVAQETIRAIETEENYIFPDPHLKDIYTVLRESSNLSIKREGNVFKPESKAA